MGCAEKIGRGALLPKSQRMFTGEKKKHVIPLEG
jgi:hypothetical protein